MMYRAPYGVSSYGPVPLPQQQYGGNGMRGPMMMYPQNNMNSGNYYYQNGAMNGQYPANGMANNYPTSDGMMMQQAQQPQQQQHLQQQPQQQQQQQPQQQHFGNRHGSVYSSAAAGGNTAMQNSAPPGGMRMAPPRGGMYGGTMGAAAPQQGMRMAQPRGSFYNGGGGAGMGAGAGADPSRSANGYYPTQPPVTHQQQPQRLPPQRSFMGDQQSQAQTNVTSVAAQPDGGPQQQSTLGGGSPQAAYSFYGNQMGDGGGQSQFGSCNAPNNSLQRTTSVAEYDLSEYYQPASTAPMVASTQPVPVASLPSLQRKNTMTLQRTFSATGGFYDYGDSLQQSNANGVMGGFAGRAPQYAAHGMSGAARGGGFCPNVPYAQQQGFNMGGYQAPMHGGFSAARGGGNFNAAGAPWQYNGAVPPHAFQQATGPVENQEEVAPQKPLGRLASQSRINTDQLSKDSKGKFVGMYFKNKAPVGETDVSYQNAGDPGVTRSKDGGGKEEPCSTRVRQVLMFHSNGGSEASLQGDAAVVMRNGEETTFKQDEVLGVDPTDLEVFSDTLDEMRDLFTAGGNVGLLLADAGSPIATPWDWPSWRALRKLVKEVLLKLESTSMLTVSITLLNDDQVTDLLADEIKQDTLVVANSPMFGPVVHGVVYETISSADQFNETLDTALRRIEADPDDEDEQGIVLVSAILKQIKSRTSYTEGDEGDVLLSSLFATGVGSGFIHYTRILDKNPAEPRAMFQFALGGPCMTASAITLSSSDGNAHQILTMQQRMGASKNFPLRRGSLRRFVKYSSESMPRTREKIEGLKNPAEKTALTRSLERLELMVDDAEAMLKNPEKELPKTYIRN